MSSNDKVYKLSLDAFSKLRNDHELFLDAYEKPTQIYRFLKACHALKPLFLHRNLSYLKHRNSRRGKKRQRKLKVDDLINHTHNEKHDLASEIKSGNCLDITVTELREGIDFKKMLDNPHTPCNGPEVSGSSQLMEVEALLYHFTQPSVQASQDNSSYPCSCTTLGKCTVEFNSTNNSVAGNSEKPASAKERPVVSSSSFAIPESALSWKGRYGMQLVVFRVTPYKGKMKAEPKKVASKKAPRKSLSNVSLSRLPMTGDVLASLQASKPRDPADRQVGADNGTKPIRVHDGEEGTNRTFTVAQSSKSRKAAGDSLVPRACRRDACIMTDISYGTQVIVEQVGAQTSAPPPPPQSCCGPSRKGFSEKCTSPLFKLLPKNGLVKNGVSAVEGNAKMQRNLHSGVLPRDNAHNKHEANGDTTASEPHLRLLIKEGNGLKEEKPLVIRLPRRFVEASASESSEMDVENDDSDEDDGSVEWDDKRGRLPRRSEVQLLIDGDKPPEARVRTSDIPVLLAEDVKNRSTRRSTSAKVSSHHNGGGLQRAAVEASCPVTSPRNGSKRSLSSEMDVFTPPPAKHSRPNSEVRDDPVPPLSQMDAVDCSTHEEDFVDCLEEPMVELQSATPQPQTSQSRTLPLHTSQSGTPQPQTSQFGTPQPQTSQSGTPRSQTSQDVYVAELAMFDSRGLCLLEDGEYDLLMQRCLEGRDEEPSRLFTFAPLSWDTVFGGCTKESPEQDSTNSNTMLLKVTFHWRHGPPPHRLANDLDTALDFRKLREAYVSKPTGPTVVSPMDLQPVSDSRTAQDNRELANSTAKSPCVIFNFLYNNNTIQQTELRQGLACPWCCLSCRKIYSLLKHMSLCHPRFIFTYMPTNYGSSIDVHVNKLYDGSATPEVPGEYSKLTLMHKKRGPVKCSPFTAVLVEKGCVPEEDVTEFLNDGSWKRGINTNRQYYHTQSCTPLFPDELEFDSENDEIPEWQKICSQRMLDEFTDVNRGEKELMKLWNLFAMENRLVADKEVSAACIKFATRMKAELIEKHIVYNFMAHLASLFDYGLVTAAAVHQSLSIVLGTHNS